MKILHGGRGSGKTTALIKVSHNTGKRILCVNHKRVRYVIDLATHLGYVIPKPLAIGDRTAGLNVCEILVDDVEHVLHALLGGIKIDLATTSSDIYSIEYVCDKK